MWFFSQKKKEKKTYDPELRTPAIRVSICTGEQVAGFENKESGRFEEIVLIRSEKDLKDFKERYGIEGEIRKIY